MGYVAARGGELAIQQAERFFQQLNGPIDAAFVRAVVQLMPYLVDRVMGEGSLYAPELAALALAPELVLHGRGLTAIPGIIDMHGDMLEGEVEPRPGANFPIELAVLELDKRLAGSGITTAYAGISFWETVRREKKRSAERACAMVAAIHAQRDSLLIDMFVHARYEVTTPSVAPALIELLEGGQVHLLSLMDHTPGQRQYRNVEQYVDFIANAPVALLQAVFLLADTGVLPLYQAAKLTGENPAAALGLHDRGRIEVGLQADIALIEQTTLPRVRGTIRRGVPIYWDGALALRTARS